MNPITNIPLRTSVGLLIAILAILIGGTWFTVKTTTDHLLYRNATETARNWAQYLATNVGDLEQIAAGETPSAASMQIFRATSHSKDVYRYVIFNRYGYSILEAERGVVTPVEVSDYSATAARSLKNNETIVDAKAGTAAGQPKFFSEAYVPVLVGGRPVATVTAYVDQSDQRNDFVQTTLISALSLCGLTGLAFGLPAIAWYRRTREKQQADRRIQFLAHHDILTGLANRARVIERIEAALAVVPANGGMVALLFVDIDHFKQVNDTFGHDGGDFLLKAVGDRLRSVVRADDMVARLGGDEFVVLQIAVASRDDADGFARRVASILSVPCYFNEQEILPSFTIGVALGPADGNTAERLLKSADLALYAGKTAGRKCIRFFTPELDEELQKRIAIEKLIRDAVTHERFVLHYQPLFEMAHKHLIGFEALLRLPAPDGTLIPPDEFIPLAEEMHLIDRIGAWVLRETCRVAKTWPEPLTIAVNLSPAQFESGMVEAEVADALRESGLAPQRLELEITERLLLANTEAVIGTLGRLKQMGVSIVMDDFGTGYSSLSYLWKFPFDKIKIDRSFMENFEKSGRDVETVVKTIIALGREMKMRVTVEGVEPAGQVDFLYDAHADQVQGFYFGRPVPARAVTEEMLANILKSGAPAAVSEVSRPG